MSGNTPKSCMCCDVRVVVIVVVVPLLLVGSITIKLNPVGLFAAHSCLHCWTAAVRGLPSYFIIVKVHRQIFANAR
jgi:hypothetical protein